MLARIPCVSCNGPLDITPDLVGQRLACPHCGHPLTISYQGHRPVAMLMEPVVSPRASIVSPSPAARRAPTKRPAKRGQHPAIVATMIAAGAALIGVALWMVDHHLSRRAAERILEKVDKQFQKAEDDLKRLLEPEPPKKNPPPRLPR